MKTLKFFEYKNKEHFALPNIPAEQIKPDIVSRNQTVYEIKTSNDLQKLLSLSIIGNENIDITRYRQVPNVRPPGSYILHTDAIILSLLSRGLKIGTTRYQLQNHQIILNIVIQIQNYQKI